MTPKIKILLIKRGAIGDILMTTPLIRQLKIKLKCQLDVLSSQDAIPVLQNNPYLDNQIILPAKVFRLTNILYLAYRLWLLRSQYDYVFVLDKHWYFSLMSLITGAKRVGFWRDPVARFLLNSSVYYSDVSRYQVLYYLDLLAVSGLAIPDYNDIELDLPIPSSAVNNVHSKLLQLNLVKYVVVVNSGGNNQFEHGGIRMLPHDKILRLLQDLLATQLPVILLGGTVDNQTYMSYIQELGAPPNLINWAGCLSIVESAMVIKLASHFYTTDCGAMHLGIAVGKHQHMTAFFGPTNPAHILPHKYLQLIAKWNDMDKYSPNYQLYGKLRPNEPQYFLD